MNNKAFTLVELLAIMVIISIIITILYISVGPTIKDYEKNLSDTQTSIIEEAANVYYLKEGIKESYKNRDFKLCVNINYLIENDYIEDESIKSIYDNEKLEGSVEITYSSEQYTYKYKENNCKYEYQAIDPICTAVTEKTKTTGNIPKGKYLPGDEYICEVKNKTKYHFFVLGTNNDGTVNLIMERNVYYNSSNNTTGLSDSDNPGLIAWMSEVDYGCGEIGSGCSMNDKGPVTAMTYLHNATKDWDNIPNIIMDYDDENVDYYSEEKRTSGYGGIKTTANTTIITSKTGEETGRIENLKSRMPRYNELHGMGKCPNSYEIEENTECPLWIANNPEDFNHGYWILSSYNEDSIDSSAWFVYSFALNYRLNVYQYESNEFSLGVRPVISIPKLDIAN